MENEITGSEDRPAEIRKPKPGSSVPVKELIRMSHPPPFGLAGLLNAHTK